MGHPRDPETGGSRWHRTPSLEYCSVKLVIAPVMAIADNDPPQRIPGPEPDERRDHGGNERAWGPQDGVAEDGDDRLRRTGEEKYDRGTHDECRYERRRPGEQESGHSTELCSSRVRQALRSA